MFVHFESDGSNPETLLFHGLSRAFKLDLRFPRVGSYLERSLLSRLSEQHSQHAEISLSSRVRSFQEDKPVSFRPYVTQNLGLTLE